MSPGREIRPIDTAGCNMLKEFDTPGCRISVRTYSRQYEEDDDWWSALDGQTGVPSQGPTRSRALETLAEAVAVTGEARGDETPALEPDTPWFEG